MTTQQIILAGALLAVASLTFLIVSMRPRHASLAAWLTDNTADTRTTTNDPAPTRSLEQQIGIRTRQLIGRWSPAPIKDLNLLRGAETGQASDAELWYYSQKGIHALIGFTAPTVFAALMWATGRTPSVALPIACGILLGVVAGLLPDITIRRRAAAAREEFQVVLTSYIDLVTMERASGTAPRQAMEEAAAAADSWVFTRLHHELRKSARNGEQPWDVFERLGDQFGIHELTELGRQLRTAGVENASIYKSLIARAKSLRTAYQARETTRAKEASNSRSAPIAGLAITILLLIGIPAVLNLMNLAQ